MWTNDINWEEKIQIKRNIGTYLPTISLNL